MDYKVLEIARAYSDDAETLVKNYNRIVEGLKIHDINVSENRYTEKDFVSFGNYLLSKERKDRYSENPKLPKSKLEEKLSKVNNSDLWNWKHINDK